jgi:ribosomal protein L37AE/L43A
MEIKNPIKNPIIYECKSCDYITYHKGDYTKHISTMKHKRNHISNILEINGNEKSQFQNNIYKFSCEICNYNTNKKRDLNKHKINSNHNQNVNDIIENKINNCDKCNKSFTTSSGLWKHRKKCEFIKTIDNDNTNTNINISVDLIKEVIKESKELQNVLIEQNKELQNKLLEQNKEHKEQIIEMASKQTTHINTQNNQQFNLQFFLNETCKDAMNLVDFVNSLKLTPEDFETTGRLGFVDGISRIFIKELKKLNTEKLPIHCTDLKRETVYIKNNNIWEKENDEKHRLKWTIDRIADLNLNQHHEWQAKYPQCRENNTPENHKFVELTSVALGGRGKEQEDKFREKIMRNVIKEVVLDKKNTSIK